MSLSRLWRTVKPLRPEQVLGRLQHEARLRLHRRWPMLLVERIQDRGLPLRRAVTLPPPTLDTSERARLDAARASGKVRAGGHEVDVTAWAHTALPKLVRYHLHYLETARGWIEASPELERVALDLIQRWSRENPPSGEEGWEPYPVSARLQNLCLAAAVLGPRAPDWLLVLISVHARYVAAFPERHLLANHLLKNWIALTCAGLLLEGTEPAEWLAKGAAGLVAELGEQLLPDGAHYERSPMYHALLLRDLLDVRDLARARDEALPMLESSLARMAEYLAATLHPDGDIPLFNDSALGEAPLPAALFARLGGVPPAAGGRIFDAKDSGLMVLRPSREEAVVFDSGPLGPSYQPGHAHSDTLSYELSVAGERRVVNAGGDGYQSVHRAFFRSAVAHNTVTVNGDGPDELWSSFRVGGRSRVTMRRVDDALGVLAAHGALEAFQGWTQERSVLLFPRKGLVVVDTVRNAGERSLVISRARLLPGKSPLRFVPLSGRAERRPTAYAPELGRIFEADEHSVQAEGNTVRLAYALLWGGERVELREREGGKEVEVQLDAQTYRVKV